MTKKEAIEILEIQISSAEFYARYTHNDKDAEKELKHAEAFRMAIKALQTEPTHEAEPTHGRLIDVDELLKKYTTCEDIDCHTCPIWDCGCDGLLQILKEAPIIKDAKGDDSE
jgi:hypothetical protein